LRWVVKIVGGSSATRKLSCNRVQKVIEANRDALGRLTLPDKSWYGVVRYRDFQDLAGAAMSEVFKLTFFSSGLSHVKLVPFARPGVEECGGFSLGKWFMQAHVAEDDVRCSPI
jgi:hypothetical protein